MTQTLNETDTDWLTLIDWEEELSCVIENCDNPPEWKVSVRCCGASALMCDFHKEYEFYVTNVVGGTYCLLCHTNNPKLDAIKI